LSHQYLGMVYKLDNISLLMFDVRTGSIASRAKNLDRLLQEKARGRGINFMAHSMGGLDCRYLITHVQPSDYITLSLTTISTPHRGSPFVDWCAVGTRHLSLFCSVFTSLELRKTSASGGSRSKTYSRGRVSFSGRLSMMTTTNGGRPRQQRNARLHSPCRCLPCLPLSQCSFCPW